MTECHEDIKFLIIQTFSISFTNTVIIQKIYKCRNKIIQFSYRKDINLEIQSQLLYTKDINV